MFQDFLHDGMRQDKILNNNMVKKSFLAMVLTGFFILIFSLPIKNLGAEETISRKSGRASDKESTKEDSEPDVEALYDRLDEDQIQKTRVQRKKEQNSESKSKEITTLSDLVHLSPFNDIAVIQRKFLPHTNRFELAGAGLIGLNNPFFNNLGAEFRAAYYLAEKHGIEAQYLLFTNDRRSVTTNLEDKRDVRTSNLVTPKSYAGLAYKWSPFYGKITFLNYKIVPFDISFTTGLGMTRTERRQEPTFHLGAGQAFALSKSTALRWDLVWNFYSAEVVSTSGTGVSKSSHNDLFLSLGMSFFVPEAKYR